MSHGHDIRAYLDLPVAVGGVIDLSQATVKEEIVKETLDPAKGAVIDFGDGAAGNPRPTITTAPTLPGLTYSFYEGTTLEAVGAELRSARPSDSKIGDGTPWTPTITVKGGKSGFYTIGVAK